MSDNFRVGQLLDFAIFFSIMFFGFVRFKRKKAVIFKEIASDAELNF